jgi:hypothetical protein
MHAEFRVNFQEEGFHEARREAAGNEGVWPLEIAARPIGGLCARALRFIAPGETKVAQEKEQPSIGLEELLLRHALNFPGSDWRREHKASGVMMIPVPASGTLERVEGEEAARAIRGITDLFITARLRDYIAAWPEGSSYLGFLFASADTPEEVVRALRAAHAELRFSLAPRLPVQHPMHHLAG